MNWEIRLLIIIISLLVSSIIYFIVYKVRFKTSFIWYLRKEGYSKKEAEKAYEDYTYGR